MILGASERDLDMDVPRSCELVMLYVVLLLISPPRSLLASVGFFYPPFARFEVARLGLLTGIFYSFGK